MDPVPPPLLIQWFDLCSILKLRSIDSHSIVMHVGLPSLTCADGMVFLSSVHACVLQSQLGSVEYYNAYLQPGRECAGGHFHSSAELQRLRLCSIVNESIVLDGIGEAIDPTVFWDIEEIAGLRL